MAINFGLACATHTEGQGDVFDGRQVVDESEVLEHDTDLLAQFRQFCARSDRHILIKHVDEAPCRSKRQIHQLEECRFARAAGARQEVERARGKLEADIAQNFRADAISHADVFEAQQKDRLRSGAKMSRNCLTATR